MATITITRGESLEGFYARTLEYLHKQYHNYPKGPATANKYELTTAEKAEMAYYDSLGNYDAANPNQADDNFNSNSNVGWRCRRRLFRF